jgi:phospholipid/cholesterol/gamma-HCH transport system substrate-binding protein
VKIENMAGKIAGLAAFGLVCVAIFLYLFKSAGGNISPGHRYSFTANIQNSFQLVPQADVRSAGVKIGRVTAIDEGANNGVKVKIEIQDKYRPVYNDTRLLLRTKTLVGENYLDLTPGTPAAGAIRDGAELPLKNSEDAVQLDDILSAMDKPTRTAVQANLRSLGDGFGAREGKDLNRLLGATRPTVTDGTDLMTILQKQRGKVASLVDDTGQVMQAFADRTADVRGLAAAAKKTSEAVAERDQAVRETIAELPATLTQAQRTSSRLASFSSTATPVVRNLRLASVDLTPVVQDLQPTAAAARSLVNVLPGTLTRLDPVLTDLKQFTAAARPLMPALDALLRQANPALTYLAPYSREVGSFFANVGTMNGIRDSVGQIGRVQAQVGENSLTFLQPDARKALGVLLDAGLVTAAHSQGQNPYIKPGEIGAAKPFTGTYPQVQAAGR